jgi:hypothetical protein
MALSWLNLPYALKAAIGIGKQTLGDSVPFCEVAAVRHADERTPRGMALCGLGRALARPAGARTACFPKPTHGRHQSARRVVPKREGGSPYTDETTYAHERSRFTTIAAAARPCRPCPAGRVRGRVRLLGPQASPCYSAS